MAAALINHIVLNENAYFLKKEANNYFSNNFINDVFKAASEERKGNYLLNLRNQVLHNDAYDARYSICVFKFQSTPSFIDTDIPRWKEEKLAYLFVVDFKDYVLISKKNVSGIDDLLFRELVPIDYSVLSTLFEDDNTSYEKFSLNSTSVSADDLKGKTVEARDLKKSYSTFGSGRYILNSLRLRNADEKTSIVFNTSRVAKFGEKKYIDDLIDWAWNVIEKIRNHVQRDSFLNAFAAPIDYQKNKESLKPISILFNTVRLHDDIENNRIARCVIQLADGRTRSVPLNTLLKITENVFNISERISSEETSFILNNELIKDIETKLNDKSITLRSKKAAKVFLIYDDDSKVNLLSYFNHYNDFIINFEDLSLVYTARKLFKDSKLIGYIDNFMDVFRGRIELNATNSEKGTFLTTSVSFSPDSLFDFIENRLISDAEYVLCDDLGDEWGDFIKLKSGSISLIHAKFGTSQFSASSFH